jgi:hypothetical protein
VAPWFIHAGGAIMPRQLVSWIANALTNKFDQTGSGQGVNARQD